MIHIFQPPAPKGASSYSSYNHELGRRLAATGLGLAVDVEAGDLERRLRAALTAHRGGVVVIDSGYLDLLGIPCWLRELPALGETRLLWRSRAKGATPRTPEHDARRAVERAWTAAVDAVISTTDRPALETDCDVTTFVVRPGVAPCFRPAPRNHNSRLTIVATGAVTRDTTAS